MAVGDPDGHGRRCRIARSRDLDAVRSITVAAYENYVPILGGRPAPMDEEYGSRINSEQVWLLEVENEVAGLLVLERHPDHAMIFSVAVVPERHGEGHGRALLRLAEEVARSWGCGELRLYTNALMRRNLLIYRAAGFRETGRRPHPVRSGFEIVDMARRLD